MSNSFSTPILILLVENEPDFQLLVRSTLRSDPRLALCAETVDLEETLKIVEELKPALVILDHQLDGEMLGLQGAPLIKASSPETRIILFTGQDLSYEASQEPAIDLYLSKADIRQLLPAAQVLLGLGGFI